MAVRRIERISIALSERLASTWRLLSDTTNFLSRTSVFPQYERELMDMRRRLSSSHASSEAERGVRNELTAMRKALREQGYDLSLGRLDLSFEGFRNDAAESEGFRRLVLFLGAGGPWYATGEDNHMVLHDRLDRAVSGSGRRIEGKHYLWYRWSNGLLVLSGSDTESREDFEALKAWCDHPERRLHLLARLKGL